MARIFRHYVSPVKVTLALTDFVIVLGSVFLAEWLRYAGLDLTLDSGAQALLAKILVPAVFVPVLLGVGGYQSDAIRDIWVFIVRLILTVFVASMILAAFLFILPMLPLWRSILVLAMVIAALAIFALHGIFLTFAGKNFLRRRVVLLGAGEEAAKLKKYAEKATEAGLNIIGTVCLPEQTAEIEDAVVLEDINFFDRYAIQNEAEMVLIADQGLENLPLEALMACKLSGIEIKDRLSFFEQVRGYVDLASVQSEWIIFSDGFRSGSGLERFLKRLLDVSIGLITLILAAPLMVLAIVAIRLTSVGPVLYKQQRVGLNGKTFNLLKFRSMKVDAEKHGEPQWAQKSDPRVTFVGGFLRRTRIDELPQIMNVLGGDMSFVGPRPERPFFVDQFEKEIPFYRERHCVKPGMTGWAQIQYPYGASVEDSKRKLEYDLYYIKNYSVFLDILIILQTVSVVIFSVGAR